MVESGEGLPPPPAARPACPQGPPDGASGVEAPPLNEEHYRILREASAARAPLRAAAATARFSACTLLIIGLAGVPVLLFLPSLTNLVIVGCLCAAGMVEWHGARRLRCAEIGAAEQLAVNQLGLFLVIAVYCVLRMVDAGPPTGGVVSEELRAQLSQVPALQGQVEQIAALGPMLTRVFYGLVVLLSAAFQGGLAGYYYTRRRYVDAARRSWPAWAIRVLDEAGG